MKALYIAFGLSLASALNAAELVKVCDVGVAKRQRVEVLREARIGDSYIYSIRHARTVTPFFGGPEQSRGEPVSIRCVGKFARALIVWGEFTANALQGFVLISPKDGASLARLDFAEKVPPSQLYLGPREVMLAFPTMGLGETNTHYVVYRYRFGPPSGEQVEAGDILPSPDGFEVIQLNQSSKVRKGN
ncbi:hypothetical protein GTP23_02995 [Pseudoduganella sp. FT93W]|uniref:Uncharacterized protein n=1 Tax=Duganella fentianensis TaxID=2692177 RepID=A0A845HSR5_9BURK|nr:hypothetical protein [Duganella fentianensis]MYN44033.1 hypothetical protein [Duganella fentianensis]